MLEFESLFGEPNPEEEPLPIVGARNSAGTLVVKFVLQEYTVNDGEVRIKWIAAPVGNNHIELEDEWLMEHDTWLPLEL